MSTIAAPSSLASRRYLSWVIVPSGLVVVALLGWAGVRGMSASPASAQGAFVAVVPMDLQVKIAKDGELQAVNNIDIYCEVEGQTIIQKLVSEGGLVKKGDVLAELDSFAIRQKIEDTMLDVQRAEAEMTTATEMKEIQAIWNAANLESAEVGLKLAKLDLRQYVEGSYPQQLADAQTALEMAEITLKNKQEELEQTRKLFAKGFVTAADVKKSELEVTTARNGVSKAQTALIVLKEYQHPMNLASKQNAVAQAEARLVRTKNENASNISQKQADLTAKKQALAAQKRRLERHEDQLAKCTVRAPADGIVVYASSGDRNAQNQIQEGAQVRERQLLFRLPDTTAMKAVVRVQESQVARLRNDQRATVKIVGIPGLLDATVSKISVMADSGQRWWNPDLKEYPVDLVLDETPPDLKPGVGVQAEIYIEHLQQVLAVPLAAVYSAGSDSYVFARQGSHIAPVRVTTAEHNEAYVQITQGLGAGQEVLLLKVGQGRELLEKAGIKTPPAGGAPNGEPRPRRRPA